MESWYSQRSCDEMTKLFAVMFNDKIAKKMTLNKHLQRGQMDVLIRFWDTERNIARTRYLTSQYLGGSNAEQLLEAFEKAVGAKVEPSKLLQVSSDGPNVNLRFLQLLGEAKIQRSTISCRHWDMWITHSTWQFKSICQSYRLEYGEVPESYV